MKTLKVFLPIILTFVIFFSCSKEENFEPEYSTVPGDGNSSCAYLTYDNTGNPVLVWVEKPHAHDTNGEDHSEHGTGTGEGYIRYSVSTDGGKTFDNIQTVTSVDNVNCHSESMPKLVFTEDGKVYAFFGHKMPTPENKWAGGIYYTYSIDNGQNWTTPQMVHSDKSAGVGRDFFDATILPDGSVGIVWLDGRDKLESGSQLYFAKSGENGEFNYDVKIAETVCECCRTVLKTDSEGVIRIAYRDIFESGARDMAYIISADTAKTFSEPVPVSSDNWIINACPHTGPAMAEMDGKLYFTWMTRGGGEGIFYNNTPMNETDFTIRLNVTDDQTAMHPQITALSNGLAIVWDETLVEGKDSKKIIRFTFIGKDGTVFDTKFSDKDGNSVFPVIIKTGEESFTTAWTVKDGKTEKVVYKSINMSELSTLNSSM